MRLSNHIFPDLKICVKDFLSVVNLTKKYSDFAGLYQKMENDYDDFFDKKVVGVTNETEAITVALQTICDPGDRVVIPDFTNISTLCAVKRAHMTPILTHCDQLTWTLSISELQKRKDFFDAFVVTAPFGYSFDLEPYETFAAENNKKIVYDLSDSFPWVPKTNHPICYSFHTAQTFGCGEGGMVFFSNSVDRLAAKMVINFNKINNDDVKNEYGFNAKIDEFRSQLFISILENISVSEKRIKRRKIMAKHYFDISDDFYRPDIIDQDETPALIVIGGVKNTKLIEIEGERHGIQFEKKYNLLSKMRGLRNVSFFTASGDWADECLAVPADILGRDKDFAEIKEILCKFGK